MWSWFDLQLDAPNNCPFTYNTFTKLVYVLYVNGQEFGASNWRSNHYYTKMHGQPTIKTTYDINNQIITKLTTELLCNC